MVQAGNPSFSYISYVCAWLDVLLDTTNLYNMLYGKRFGTLRKHIQARMISYIHQIIWYIHSQSIQYGSSIHSFLVQIIHHQYFLTKNLMMTTIIIFYPIDNHVVYKCICVTAIYKILAKTIFFAFILRSPALKDASVFRVEYLVTVPT